MRRLFAVFFALGTGFFALVAALPLLFKRREDTEWKEAVRPGKVVAVDGVAIHYVDSGSGPVIIMIHGFGGHTFSFRYQMADLAGEYRTVAIDLKGFGYSERPGHEQGDYSLTE
jgi:alpha-beta hydrolase superfamily lysophospholipase